MYAILLQIAPPRVPSLGEGVNSTRAVPQPERRVCVCVGGGSDISSLFPKAAPLPRHPRLAGHPVPLALSCLRVLGLWGFALVGASCPWLFRQPLNGLLASGSSLSSDCAIRQPDGAGLRRNLIKPLRMPSWSPTPSQLLEVVHEAQVLTTLCPVSQPGKDRDLTG